MRTLSLALAVLLMASLASLADPPFKNKGVPPGQAKKDGVPPGLAKKGGLPPGLAKKGGLPPGLAKRYGPRPPDKAYVAFDPRYEDRAWFLIDRKWVLKEHFDSSLRAEVRDALLRPPVPPPIPLPRVKVEFRVVLFQ